MRHYEQMVMHSVDAPKLSSCCDFLQYLVLKASHPMPTLTNILFHYSPHKDPQCQPQSATFSAQEIPGCLESHVYLVPLIGALLVTFQDSAQKSLPPQSHHACSPCPAPAWYVVPLGRVLHPHQPCLICLYVPASSTRAGACLSGC